MLDKFPIDPREWKEKTGWATSNAFEIDVVAVTEKKAHLIMRNCRRLRDDGSLIEEASAFYAFKTTDAGWKMYAFSDITFQLNSLLYRQFAIYIDLYLHFNSYAKISSI